MGGYDVAVKACEKLAAEFARRADSLERQAESEGSPDGMSDELFTASVIYRRAADECTMEADELVARCGEASGQETAPVAVPDGWEAAVDAEPELPGPMPQDLWEVASRDKGAMVDLLRIVVRQTKQGIKERLSDLYAAPPAPAVDGQELPAYSIAQLADQWADEIEAKADGDSVLIGIGFKSAADILRKKAREADARAQQGGHDE